MIKVWAGLVSSEASVLGFHMPASPDGHPSGHLGPRNPFVCPVSSSYKDTSQIGSGVTLRTPF